MAKRISPGEPKPRRTPARRTEKPAASPVEPAVKAVTAAPAPEPAPAAVMKVTPAKLDREAVARRAFELFLARGGAHGHDREDWLAAERELRRR